MTKIQEAMSRFLYVTMRVQGLGREEVYQRMRNTCDFNDDDWVAFLNEMTNFLSKKLEQTKERN